MKLEKLSKGKFKKYIIVLMVISIFGVIFINKSKAKYRVTQSVQIVNGTVNYKVPDLNVLALYKQKTEGNTNDDNYESITDVSGGNYVVNTDKSYCTIPGTTEQQKNIPMEYKDGRVSISINKKGTKCYVYLDIQTGTAISDLLIDIPKKHPNSGVDEPNFNKRSCSDVCSENTTGLYTADDDFGISSYFRGSVDYNWVKFGKVGSEDIYWRIIRFNGNGTIRLIYSGKGSPATTGEDAFIGTSKFNSLSDGSQEVKFMLDDGTDSIIKGVLDVWYTQTSNLHEIKQEQHIDGETGFCNDTGVSSISLRDKILPAQNRLTSENRTPTLKCGTSKDLFTKSGNKGNNKLTNPVGLITADELVFAGEAYGVNNFYLYTFKSYWTMSPYGFNGSSGQMFIMNSYMDDNYSSNSFGVRPVINLKADTTFTGDGTKDSPYEVVI